MMNFENDDHQGRIRYSKFRNRSRSPIREKGDRHGNSKQHDDSRWEKRVLALNLPYNAKWFQVKDLVKDKIEEAPFVDMMENSEGEFTGTALLEFRSAEVARKAVTALNKKCELNGRSIVVREPHGKDKHMYAMSREKNKSRGNFSSDPVRNVSPHSRQSPLGLKVDSRLGLRRPQYDTFSPSECRVVVSNIPVGTQERILEDLLSEAGYIRDLVFKQYLESNTEACVVEYETGAEAEKAVRMLDKTRLLNRVLRVQFESEETTNVYPSEAGGLRLGSRSNDFEQPLRIKERMRYPEEGLRLGRSTGRSLEEDDVSFFKARQEPPSYVHNESVLDVKQGSLYNDRRSYGKVSYTEPKSNNYSSGASGRSSGLLNSFTRPIVGLDKASDEFRSPQFCEVLVKNIPPIWESDDLRSTFQDAAHIVSAEILRTGSGHSSGIGVVGFSSYDEAHRAIRAMHGLSVAGRTLDLSMNS